MKNGDMPATGHTEFSWDNQPVEHHEGLTKREHFAAMAMQGFCSKSRAPETLSTVDKAASVAVEMADALLKALEQE